MKQKKNVECLTEKESVYLHLFQYHTSHNFFRNSHEALRTLFSRRKTEEWSSQWSQMIARSVIHATIVVHRYYTRKQCSVFGEQIQNKFVTLCTRLKGTVYSTMMLVEVIVNQSLLKPWISGSYIIHRAFIESLLEFTACPDLPSPRPRASSKTKSLLPVL